MNTYVNQPTGKFAKQPQPTFTRISRGVYTVWLADRLGIGNVRCGTVEKRESPMFGTDWFGRYNDGSPAYSADTRIDAAWALINS